MADTNPILHELLTTTDPDGFVAKHTDLGEIDLACAVGLPNAGDIDIPKCLAQLDAVTSLVRMRTDKGWHLFDLKPAEFHNSKNVFRVFIMAHVLYKHFGIHYNPKIDRKNPSFGDPHDQFICGVLGPRKCGTCASLPILAIAVGRRLGYPLKLAKLPHHLLFRWDDGTELVNFEYTGQGARVRPQEHYYSFPVKWDQYMHEEQARYGIWLTSMSPRREMATCLVKRAAVLNEHGLYEEELKCWEAAQRFDPDHPHYDEIRMEMFLKMTRHSSYGSGASLFPPVEPGREMLNVLDLFRDRSKDPKRLHIRVTSLPPKT